MPNDTFSITSASSGVLFCTHVISCLVPAVLGASPCCLCYPLGWCCYIVFGVVVWQAGNEGRWAHVGLVWGGGDDYDDDDGGGDDDDDDV
jgi:hypothetical protein